MTTVFRSTVGQLGTGVGAETEHVAEVDQIVRGATTEGALDLARMARAAGRNVRVNGHMVYITKGPGQPATTPPTDPAPARSASTASAAAPPAPSVVDAIRAARQGRN